MKRPGFVGVGALGGRMAPHLLRAGHEVGAVAVSEDGLLIDLSTVAPETIRALAGEAASRGARAIDARARLQIGFGGWRERLSECPRKRREAE